MNSFPWKPKSHFAKMEMNSGRGVSEVPHLANLLLPSRGPQGQVYLALNQLLSISVSSPRIWQSEGCWLPDRIHQIHFPDAIASDAERKIGCPEIEVGKDKSSWEMHNDKQNNKERFLLKFISIHVWILQVSLHPSDPIFSSWRASTNISG